jgi:nucleoside-diphosphate-sugar epimerase
MRILITGAAGYLGNKLAHKLARQGHCIHALVRSDTAKELLQHPNIIPYKGDLLEKESLKKAIVGCNQVYHTAAKVGAWASDPSLFYKVNVEGTRNVLDAALQWGVAKTVYTSTCGVFGPTQNGPLDENHTRTIGFAIDYDRSKKEGEDIVRHYASTGMNTVIASPSKVYGPGHTSHSLTANAIIDRFLKKGITFIPSPGTYKVCLAYIDDVVDGHIAAMDKGTSGGIYILGGINISYLDFFKRIRTLSCGNGRIIQLPKSTVKVWATLQQRFHQFTGKPIRFTPRSVDHLFSTYTFSSEKAIRELDYTVTPLDEALTKTIHFLNHSHHA